MNNQFSKVNNFIQHKVDTSVNQNVQRVFDLYKLLSKYTRDIIIFVRWDGKIIEANESAVKAYGYNREELLAMGIYDLRASETKPTVGFQMEQASRNGILFETIHQRKDGSTFYVEVSSQGTTIGDERILVSVIRDITDRKKLEENLRFQNEELEASYEEIVATEEELKQKYEEQQKTEDELRTVNQQLSDIIEFLPDATFVVGKTKRIIAWNRAMEEITGLSKQNMIGKGDYAYTIPFYGVPRPCLIDYVLTGNKEIELLYENVQRSGSSFFSEFFVPSLFGGIGAYLWVKTSPLYDSNKNLVGAIESIRDITQRKNMEEQLKYISYHDHLTNLYNRRYFEEMIGHEGICLNPASILLCDVDGLKLVNDTFGHKAGDNLLKATAEVIKGSCRPGDLVARIGGDEFAVLLPNCDKEAIKKTCDKIQKLLSSHNSTYGDTPLSLSIGSATRVDGSIKLTDLFKEADNKMYREKLHHNQSARSALVQTLMKALEARDYITEGHAERLQDMVVKLAMAIGLQEDRITDLRLLARFHDIGKVGIPDRILFKPGPLSLEESIEMRRHSEIGYRIAISASDLMPIAEWILKHHEWWNGKGYPLGLVREQIPLECRILSIADAYDAMTSDRPYRKALTHKEAVIELQRCSGSQFDPQLVEIFEPFLA